jgi:hypothetical protein
MATKAEKTILGELLEETRANRELRHAQGEVLARLDERTLAMKERIDETTTGLHGRIDGVEERIDSRVNRKATLVAGVVATVVGVILTFAFGAMGWPNG